MKRQLRCYGKFLATSLLAPCLLTMACGEEIPPIYDTEAPTEKVMSPAASLASMSLPEGFSATLFAAEPDVRQPISLNFDERGRLWVVECYTYAEGARNFDTTLRDRVLILEDTNNDGVHDKRTVFWDQGVKLTSVELGLGGVWLLAPPNLYFIADRNRDDIPDGPPEVVLDGWKENGIRHNIANGLKWGPDGWLYGRQGILETSTIGPPGATTSQRVSINCGVWRYHPLRKRVEAVLHGTTNPWGFDYDALGEMFIINTVIGHLWHVVPGVHTERMYGSDMNPFAYGLVSQVADHFHWDTGEAWHAIRQGSSDTTKAAGGGHAHSGLMIYQGNNWPAEDLGKVFAINFHGRRLNRDRLESSQSGYTARHEPDRVQWNDPWFRGIDLVSGPDGGVFVLDWSDTGECHDENGIHRSSGRIYKIVYRTPAIIAPFDLATQSPTSLAEHATNANKWWPRQARRVLRDRMQTCENMDQSEERLASLLAQTTEPTVRLEALWMLEAMGSLKVDHLLRRLSHEDENMRSWSVRLLADRITPDQFDAIICQRLEDLALAETSPRVQLYLASALQKLPIESRWKIAIALASKKNVAEDRTLGLMIWYGIEPAILIDQAGAMELYNQAKSSVIRRYVARRLAEEIERNPAMINSLLASALDPADVISGIGEAFEGWSRAAMPAHYAPSIQRLTPESKEALAETLRSIGTVFGDGRSTRELLTLLKEGDVDKRRRAIQTLASYPSAELQAVLLPMVTDRDLQVDVIRALASFGDAAVAHRILQSFSSLSDAGKESAVDTLVSRPLFAEMLLHVMETNQLPRSTLTPFHVRQVRAFEKPDLNQLLTKVWGEVRSTSEIKAKVIAMYRESTLSAAELAKGNLAHGRQVFNKQCAGCHVLFGRGRKLGPDLTGSQRKNIDYLLENLIDPSAVVAADFKAATVVMADGRSIQGVITRSNDRTITLQTKDQDLTLDRQEIDEIQTTGVSLMPEGILDSLTKDEVRDLVAYLMADHQVAATP